MPTSPELLSALVGTWSIEVHRPETSADPIPAQQRVEWIAGNKFLLQHLTVAHPDFPESVAILAPDHFHYFDSRGVSRVYAMTLTARQWRLWRADSDFWQRFTAELDGPHMLGAWEMSHDSGATWQHDFDMRYTKIAE